MNTKQTKILCQIFEQPTRSDILWNDIESLFEALGGTVKQAKGSRVKVALNDTVAVFHSPHPERETSKAAIKSVKRFLFNAGINPNDYDEI